MTARGDVTGRVRRAVVAIGRRAPREGGSAIVEFLGVTLVLLVPLVYLVLTLGRVQAGLFAAEAAARETGRILSQAEDYPQGVANAHTAVELAFADHAIVVDPAVALAIECSENPCLTPGAQLHIEVTTTVRLPLLPDVLEGALPLEVPVAAAHLAVVPEFGEAP